MDIGVIAAAVAAIASGLIVNTSIDALKAAAARLLSREDRSREVDEVITALNAATADAAREVAEGATTTSLDAELADVADTLKGATQRLQTVVEKTQSLEGEVRDLLQRADDARTTAQIFEADAEKVGRLVASQSEERFRQQISDLVERHANEVRELNKAGARAAWRFAVAGLLAGIPVGLLVNWISSSLGW